MYVGGNRRWVALFFPRYFFVYIIPNQRFRAG